MNQIKIKTSLILACGLVLSALPSALAEAHPGKHTAEGMFKAADTNNDGKVSRAEHVAGGKLMFAEMDANRDGTVNVGEMTSAHAAVKSDLSTANERNVTNDRTGANDRNVKNDRNAGGDRSVLNEKSPAAMIKMHDKNNDGQLSAAEHNAGCEAMFTKLDTNNDNSLSKDECKEGDKMVKSAG
jgi:Ca2+-binding EF-hand superfamily protein